MFPICLEVLIKALVLICAAAVALTLITPARASTRMPKRWTARFSTPHGWYQAALCIHHREGAWNSATGNGYEGGLQFLASTYASVGGRVIYRNGRPWHWASLDSPKEQLFRAWLVWRRDNGSWREWGTAPACGVR